MEAGLLQRGIALSWTKDRKERSLAATCLRQDATFEEILADYSFLEREDILAAIDYAAYQTDHSVLQTS